MKCLLFWGFDCGSDIHSVNYTKKVDLPFFPREGDQFELAGFSNANVYASCFRCTDMTADVFFDNWKIQDADELLQCHKTLIADGWKLSDVDGDGEACEAFKKAIAS